ncbi:MAG: hypothetical protein M1818_003870 [Claussenomyces sp. TS43310]|nr:MAG: hypothetical protein M1818_003870 [Claussenomyces sp. TS43310]
MAPSFTETESNGFDATDPTQMVVDKLEPIAVIGLSLKFPQEADTAENFWQMLIEGRSAMTEVPKDRWNIDSFYHPNADRHDAMNARGGHFLKEDISLFDAPFFSMPPAEAVCMDPQQRSLLECTYHAFENAGIPTASVVGSRTSCYVGSFSREYEAVINRDPQLQAKYVAVGTGTAMLANRLSWFYDLRGPSISLDTACSSSLIALHLAVESMRNGESDLSIVAGCNLMLNPETNSIPLSNLGFLGRDGVCYSFDHRANGYARGEGTAVMVLKPLKQALKDNDTIRAVIRNTGSNQDGRTPGITQPSREAQAALIQETYLRAGLNFKDTGFFEAHGTGTPIGDPREAGAIGTVFKDHRTDPLVVGAVKSNIGHLEGASGLAGLIKTILILERGVIPRNIWFEKLNPDIPAEEWKLKFPTETTIWPREGLRRASVNSFGYGGANAHVIVEDAYHYLKARKLVGKHQTVAAPPQSLSINDLTKLNNAQTSGSERYRLFVWSASDEGGLKRISASYEDYLQGLHSETDNYLDNLAYTLSNRRSNMPWKSFLVTKSTGDIYSCLASGLLSKPIRSSASLNPTVAFIFTGQGAQWYAMGRELSVYPTFLNSLRSAEKYLTFLGSQWKVTEELNRSKNLSTVNDPALAQPLCTILQIALVELLAEWNISPSAVVGHSSGEIAAAYCAGAISKESAYRIAYFRGALASQLAQAKLRNGSMIAVALAEAEIQPYLNQVAAQLGPDRIVVGCVNSPKNITLTGDQDCVDLLKTIMDENRIFARKLQVTVAYHSSHMEDIASEYLVSIRGIIPRSQSTTEDKFAVMFSSVVGGIIVSDELSKPEYWVRNMVSQVKFSPALNDLCESLLREQPDQTEVAPLCLVEIGPHGALRRPVQETLDMNSAFKDVSYESALNVDVDATKSIMELVGKLHCRGCKSNLFALNTPQRAEGEMHVICNLPEYPFNHSQGYWLESRISKNYRFGEFPRHELLGVRTPDWNPLEAKWRNIIKASELPWIKDHNFNGSELYPAAGMLVMAIEASRQMAKINLKVVSYTFEDVSFYKALLVNLTTEGVETQFHLRPQKKVDASSLDRNSFNLYLFSSGEWIEVCRGTIVTDYEDEAADLEKLGPRMDDELRTAWNSGVNSCRRVLDSEDLYTNLASFGMGFGPTFQALKQVRYSNEEEASAILDPREWMGKVKDSHLTQDHVIHPTALDAVMHLTAVADSRGTWDPLRTIVPTKIAKLWISNDLLAHTKDQKLKVFTHRTFRGYRDTEFRIAAFDNLADECQILFEGYRATAITSLEPSVSGSNPLGFHFDWKPDVELLTVQQLSSLCCAPVTEEDFPEAGYNEDAELICLFYLKAALKNLPVGEITSDREHITKYMGWMKKQVDAYEAVNPTPKPEECRPSLTDTAYFQSLLSKLGRGPEMDLVNQVGKDLVKILRGEIDALEVLFGDNNSAQKFYGGLTFVPSNKKASTYIDLLAHKEPTVEILEIGAGTGGATAAILDTLATNGQGEKGPPRFGRYTYTDISPAFFETAAERFSEYLGRVEFKVLDVEKDPIEQGFEADKYDIVVASAVLHATANVEQTLRNVHKLLKPNGKLVLIEPSNPDVSRIPLIFGLLPGWWLSVEEYRSWGPLLSDGSWDDELKKAGFAGADLCLRDYEDHRHTMSVIISTATKHTSLESSPPIPKTLIIVADQSAQEHPLVKEMEAELSFLGVKAETVPYKDLPFKDIRDTFCVSLLEIEKPFLYSIQGRDWEILQTIVRSATGIVWLTRGRENDPALGLVTGLGRGLLSETPHLNFIELTLKQSCSDVTAAKHAVKIIRKSTNQGPMNQNENEYEEKDGVLYINRVVEANYLNDHLAAKLSVQKPQQQKLGAKPDGRLFLTMRNPGLLNTLQFERGEIKRQALAGDEVEVQVNAAGMNFKDVLIALGQIPSNNLGLEFSGIVLRVGTDIPADEVKPGDRVCGLASNALSTQLRTGASALIKMPDDMSFATAAAIPLSFCIAHHGLINLANVKQGDSVLIHSGAGGIGQAAIQLAMAAGADIYCTVSSREKKELLSSLYQIPDHKIFVGKGASFVPKLKKVVDGVDVVFNSLSGEGLRRSLNCMLPFGRFIDISQSDKRTLDDLPGILFAQNITYSTIDLALVLEKSKPLMRKLMNSIQKLLANSQIRAPSPLNIYKSSEIEDAFRSLQNGKSLGKTVIEMHEDDIVPVVQSSAPTYSFREDSSYVIVGGLGGLGKSTARWMVDRGAKHLILLGRSGAKGQAALEFLDEMKGRGVSVAAPPCDIGDEKVLLSVLETCTREMPPIRGCIQGSMVLRDTLFDIMSVEDYHVAVQPKAAGSWNLHKHLPASLDFFILLSSAGGVLGNRGQTNYASGNTYQDALARYRVSRGLKCIALDLGLVVGIGFAAENKETLVSVHKLGFRGILEKEYLTMLDYLCDPELPIPTDPRQAEVVTGLEIPKALHGDSREAQDAQEWTRWVSRPLFRNLVATSGFDASKTSKASQAAHAEPEVDYCAAFAAAGGSPAAAARVVAAGLRRKLARTLRMPEEDIETQKSVHAYGVDSLVAVELRYWLAKEMQADLSIFEIMGDASLGKLSGLIAKKSKLFAGEVSDGKDE